MDRNILRPGLAAAVEMAYPTVSEGGVRPAAPPQQRLRIGFLQRWFNLLGPAVEGVLYDLASLRNVAGIDSGVEGARGDASASSPRHR
jgi:hypothetical protein